jgi:hypothetical protein
VEEKFYPKFHKKIQLGAVAGADLGTVAQDTDLEDGGEEMTNS